MHTESPQGAGRRDEVVAIVDRYQLQERSKRRNVKVDPAREAEMLRLLLGVYGRNKRLIAVLNEDDRDAISAYKKHAYEVKPMNGDRPNALRRLIKEEFDRPSPKHLVVISDDPAFSTLCTFAARNNTQVSVWSPTSRIPEDLRDARFDVRYLNELLPDTYIQLGVAVVWLDIENLLIGLKEKGVIPDIKTFVDAIRQEVSDLGDVTSIIAYGDFGLLRKIFGTDVQRKLEQLGVRTRYQVNVHGKNSADMEIAGDIHTYLERDPNVETVIIGTGDRDFRPSVDAAHGKGKKVIILALKESLSRDLRQAADDVRFLDKYFTADTPSPTPVTAELRNRWVPILLRFADRLHSRRWRWAYRDKVSDLFSSDEIREALEAGLLKHGRDGDPRTLTFDFNHPLACQVYHMAWWIVERVEYLVNEKGMPYVDTHYLARGMRRDAKCRDLDIGQDRADAEAWLHAAAAADLIVKRTQPHPKAPHKQIDTWWPQAPLLPTPAIFRQREERPPAPTEV
ncbi:MAG: NYN domain-containing protein [Anaerolineae bacterium]